ncbi:MAG TPA: AAA family ATPase [Burkholderiaceae bacterium]|nr:AAA family ATPase [Burkholderiaceae bacterium]
MTTPEDPLQRSRALVHALRDALAREHGAEVPLIETHISWVLLAGSHAYKIKKPVRLSFLDFSTLALRHHFCDEELRLNRRFAPRLYLRVLPITGSEQAPRLGGDGEPIEFALQMQRMRDDDLAGARLAHGALVAADFERFATTLAAWHRTAPMAAPDGDWGTPQRVATDLANLLAEWPDADDAEAIADLRRWFDAQADDTAARTAERLATGHVRECHGDLHIDNLAWLDGQLGAFDCLEFDPALRWIDTASEVAFLAMDLRARQRHDLAHAFVDAYLEASGDATALPLLQRYGVYRALVRARVSRLREAHADSPSVAAGYLALAQRLARQWDPRLLITHGLPGSGKTWITHGLIGVAGAIRWRSDVERRRMLGSGHYQAADHEAVYARLGELARLSLGAGYPTIVDAACLKRHERDALRALAAQLRVPCLLLHCDAPREVLRQRVRVRAQRGSDASEADEAVLETLAAQAEPLADDELAHAICIDTAQGVSSASLAGRWLALDDAT